MIGGYHGGMFLLLACTPPAPADSADTGSSPGANAPAYCDEVSREEVADPYVAAAGFDFSAADVVYSNTGNWYATFEYATTGSTSARLSLDYDGGTIEAVEQVLVSPGGHDTGPATGAPDPYCPSYYDIELILGLKVGDGELAEEGLPLSLVAVSARAPTWTTTLALEALQGTATPSWDPREWAYNTLYADAYRAEELWEVTLGWWGSSESVSRRAAPKESADTGTAEAAGVSETMGTGSFWLDEG